jgi:anti-sigma-K factor RskA
MPESQTVKDCAALRQACRDAIFEKMDAQHEDVMAALSDIRVKVAEEKGARDSQAETPVAGKKFPWREVGAAIAITAGAIGAAVAGIYAAVKGLHP